MPAQPVQHLPWSRPANRINKKIEAANSRGVCVNVGMPYKLIY